VAIARALAHDSPLLLAHKPTALVAHSGTGQLYTVDPTSGASATMGGVSMPFVDGIVLEAGRLWAVQASHHRRPVRGDPGRPVSKAHALI
jgi:hypothetical protein